MNNELKPYITIHDELTTTDRIIKLHIPKPWLIEQKNLVKAKWKITWWLIKTAWLNEPHWNKKMRKINIKAWRRRTKP